MGNSFMKSLETMTNFTYTENGALAHKTTNSALYDMFALGAAMRKRSNDDVILMFRKAYAEDPVNALKCLFYIRDVRGGQGERRFFRVCLHDLATQDKDAVERNIDNIAEFGRYDDLYALFGTPCQDLALDFIKKQLALDIESKTPSLLAKWLKSENASSVETKKLAGITRNYLGLSHKQYRKMLSALRAKINIVERLMSAGQWDLIEFDKIPSKAGLVYKNAFARRDIIKAKYETFVKSTDTKVNAGALYPYDIVSKVKMGYAGGLNMSDVDKAAVNKYWENQKDYLDGVPCKMLCVCDTSASMRGYSADAPINVAIGLSMYCAERVGGPFKNKYISFSSEPQLIEVEGVDFADKVSRIYRTNLCQNTNIEKTFELLKKACLKAKPEDRPDTIVIISDMQIDSMTGSGWNSRGGNRWTEKSAATEMEKIRADWELAGLTVPHLVYWNVDARNNTFLDAGPNVSFVSGASPTLFKQVLTGKTGYDLMMDTLNAERYSVVY